MDELSKAIKGKNKIHDAVSGATETAEGHLSAVKNALTRSAKFEKDHVEQKVDYVIFQSSRYKRTIASVN